MLIIKYYHELSNHTAGTNFVLSQISQRYWIVAAREEIRNWEKQCNEWKKRKNKTASQIMGPIPSSRTRMTYRTFDQAAMDYAWPIKTIQGRGKKGQKRWLCVFTCVATRAIHLEVAFGLDTDNFLNALARFTSRRGTPTKITSDNGTNFVGAVNELKELGNNSTRTRFKGPLRTGTSNGFSILLVRHISVGSSKFW
jgi:IS30 family transposase